MQDYSAPWRFGSLAVSLFGWWGGGSAKWPALRCDPPAGHLPPSRLCVYHSASVPRRSGSIILKASSFRCLFFFLQPLPHTFAPFQPVFIFAAVISAAAPPSGSITTRREWQMCSRSCRFFFPLFFFFCKKAKFNRAGSYECLPLSFSDSRLQKDKLCNILERRG